jgi:hypothetical protein
MKTAKQINGPQCSTCDGRGFVSEFYGAPEGPSLREEPCPECAQKEVGNDKAAALRAEFKLWWAEQVKPLPFSEGLAWRSYQAGYRQGVADAHKFQAMPETS